MKKLILILLFIPLSLFSLQLKTLKTFKNAIAPKSVVVSPDGNWAAVMNLEGMDFWLINAKTLKKERRVRFYKTPAKGWDYKDKKEIDSYAEKPVECAFSPDSRYLWVSLHNAYGVVRYDIQGSHSPIKTTKKVRIYDYSQHTNWVDYLPFIKTGKTPKIIAITPNSKLALVANWHASSVSVIDLDSMTRIKNIKVGTRRMYYIPRGITISTDSSTAYVADMRGGKISVISLTNLKRVRDLQVTWNPRHVVLAKDQRTLYISDNASGSVVRYDLSTRKITGQTVVGKLARTLVLTPDQKWIIVAAHGSDELVILDAKTLKIRGRHEFYHPMGLSVSPDGKQLWVTSYQGAFVRVYSLIEENSGE